MVPFYVADQQHPVLVK